MADQNGCIDCGHRGMKIGPTLANGRRTIELAPDAWSEVLMPPVPGWLRDASRSQLPGSATAEVGPWAATRRKAANEALFFEPLASVGLSGDQVRTNNREASIESDKAIRPEDSTNMAYLGDSAAGGSMGGMALGQLGIMQGTNWNPWEKSADSSSSFPIGCGETRRLSLSARVGHRLYLFDTDAEFTTQQSASNAAQYRQEEYSADGKTLNAEGKAQAALALKIESEHPDADWRRALRSEAEWRTLLAVCDPPCILRRDVENIRMVASEVLEGVEYKTERVAQGTTVKRYNPDTGRDEEVTLKMAMWRALVWVDVLVEWTFDVVLSCDFPKPTTGSPE